MKNIYVGNLPYSVTSTELSEAFERHGIVLNCKIISDRDTGKSKGFAFVEMADDNEALAAIEAMNNSDLGGRKLRVNEARPRGDSGRGGRR